MATLGICQKVFSYSHLVSVIFGSICYLSITLDSHKSPSPSTNNDIIIHHI